jgi:hypothetical protein
VVLTIGAGDIDRMVGPLTALLNMQTPQRWKFGFLGSSGCCSPLV